jgi:CBS domain-containing protein
MKGIDMSNSVVCKRPVLVGEIMTCNPVSIDHRATVAEAAAFLSKKDISAAPVIDEAGRPMGVVSRTDIVRHLADSASSCTGAGDVPVEQVMNPEVYFVRPDTPVSIAIDDLLDCDVRRLFVVDDNDALIGLISSVDVLHHLRDEAAKETRAAWLEV